MNSVFADASYYIALLSPRDQYHQVAVRTSSELRRPIVVTDFVLIEVTNALAETRWRNKCISLWQHLRNDPSVTLIVATPDLVMKGLEFFTERNDKKWSLTDCISFVVMEEQGLIDALTADHHFEQAGFVALLRSRAT